MKKWVFLLLLFPSLAHAYNEQYNPNAWSGGDFVGIESVSRDLVASVCGDGSAPANGTIIKHNGTVWDCGTDATAAGSSSEPRADYLTDISAGFGVSVDTTEVSKDVTWSDGTLGRLGFNFNLSSGSHAMKAEANQMVFTAPVRTSGDLTIAGDDLFMGTNTSGFILVGDGTNYNPVDMSGDVDIDSSGVTTVANNSHTHTASNISDQNAGTDITADLEEETHATEHQDTGADEVAVTGGMMNADFGDYTCNGTATGCTLDPDVVSNDEVAPQAVSTDQIQATNKPQDGDILRYNATALKGQWVPCSTVTGSSALCDGSDDGAGGGGGRDTNAQREFYWPMSALLPIQASADSIAPIVKDAGTNVDYLVRAFDSSSTECVGGTFQMPFNADTAKSITLRRKYYASTAHATANRVIESFKHLAFRNSTATDGAFTEVSLDSVATDTTQDDATVASKDITLASLGWVSSDSVAFEYCRKGNALGDDLGTDLYGIDFTIEVPRSGSNSN